MGGGGGRAAGAPGALPAPEAERRGLGAGQSRRAAAAFAKRFSNTMWRAGYKRLGDGRHLALYQDDASRKVVGWGACGEAAAAGALAVLGRAIEGHGAPLSVLSGRSPAFRENIFEDRLDELRIRHMPSGEGHWQAAAKFRRMCGELERKLRLFEEASAGRTTRSPGGGAASAHVGSPFHAAPATDPIDRFFDWYNNKRPSMAPDMPRRETPAEAFRRRMPGAGDDVEGDLERSGGHARQA